MRDTLETLIRSADRSQEQLLDSMQGMFAAARAAVYSEPVQIGERTIITASEIVSGGGYGFGRGIGARPTAQDSTESDGTGAGGGGGGGGGSSSRPVAVIVVDADGVRVEPVLDVTKVALAALTASGVIVPMLIRILRPRR